MDRPSIFDDSAAALSLLPERVVHTSKYDNQLVTGISRLVRQRRVVGCLPRLDVTDD